MSFEEKYARKIINLLLENDIASYKNWLNEIKSFNSEQIDNLLNGNEYSYPVSNQKSFQKVINKFNNFQFFLQEWYKDEKYYSYLIQMWKSNLCIESLDNELLQNDKYLTKFLESNSIHYSQWPNDVKNDFKTIAKNTVGTEYSEAKDQLNKHPEIKACINGMEELKEDINNTNCDKNDKVNIINTGNTIIMFLFSILMIGAGYEYYKDYLEKDNCTNNICKTMPTPNMKKAKKICENLCKNIKQKSDGIHKFPISRKNKVKKITNIIKNGKLNNLNFGDCLSTFLKNKMVCGIHASLSFINLGWSIYEFCNVCSEIKKIDIKIEGYRNKLKSIIESFNSHLKEIKLEGDINYFLDKAKYIQQNIEKDQKELADLINKINEDIERLKTNRNKAIGGTILSVALGGIGGVGCALTGNGIALTYAVSTVTNTISGILHISDWVKCQSKINALQKLLQEAREESEIIQKEIDSLISKIKEKELEIPKYYEPKDFMGKQIKNSYL